MNTKEYSGKKILIWGLGLNDGGVGMVEFFVAQGAEVLVTDGKTEKELRVSLEKLTKYPDIKYTLGEHKEEDFKWADIIIRNPAIKPGNKWLELAQKEGKLIEMEMSLFHKLSPAISIGITGTKGKSTTSTLIYKFLQLEFGDKVILAGNIGVSAIRELPKLSKEDMVVLELSSFQLTGMGNSKISPQAAVITNLFPDHLNWHPDMEDYVESKFNIFRHQSEEDIAVVNLDNRLTKAFIERIPSTVVTFSIRDSSADYYVDSKGMLLEDGEDIIDLTNAKLQGEHNKSNIVAAVALGRKYEVSIENIQKVLAEFGGIENRQEFVRELNGVTFVNDTTATAVESVKVALNRFSQEYKKKIIMISGGIDKGLDYEQLKEAIKPNVKDLILLEGTASIKIAESLSNANLRQNHIHKYYSDFKEAISKAYSLAEKGDLVILCPGASSHNMFINEWDRGEQFKEIVNNLK